MEAFDDEDDPYYEMQKRKKRKTSKESAMLGIFADSSDEEEDLKKKPAFSKPMSFVSGGKTDESGKLVEKEGEDEDDDDYVPSMIPSSFGSTKTKKAAKEEQSNLGLKSFRVKGGNNAFAGTKADWEAHTKGIGSKLLASMGWAPGKGLGKTEQGISRPIEVKLRPKNRGLGFDFDERTQQQKEDFPTEPEQERSQVEVVEPRIQGWKRRAMKTKKVYKLPSEVEQKAQQNKLIITDMRGEQPKILSNVSDIYDTASRTSEYLPELQHNLKLLRDVRESEILSIDRKRNTEKDNINRLTQEKEYLTKIIKSEDEKISRLKEVMEIISKCNERIQSKQMTLQALAKVFLLFQQKFKEEFDAHRLYLLASALAQPLLKDKLDSWKPLSQPDFAIEEMKMWRSLTQTKSSEEAEDMDTSDADDEHGTYTLLICDLVLPKVRMALTNQWDVRAPEACLRLIEIWEPLLPRVVLDNILEQLILPKLTYEVENWNPRTDTVPIHKWLHPWLPLLGDRLSQLWATIRHKLSIVLQEWHPNDTSAHVILAPWKGVFDNAGMEALLTRSILPKLTAMMQYFVVNPRMQDIATFKALMIWEDMLPVQQLVHILETEFFPKWHTVLYTWLSNNPNYEEVTQWYLGWKQQFSAQLQANERIRAQFNHALTLMNHALSGTTLPTSVVLPALTQQQQQQQQAQPAPEPKSVSIEDMSFKQIVEKLAEEHNLFLMPTTKRHEGKVIYNFGKIPIILGKDIVHRLEKGVWKPVSLDELLDQ